jgi:hypothetical protein
LPFERIQRADKLGEIDLEENPASASLRARDETALRPRTDFFGVHVEEGRGFVEIERSHMVGPGGILAICRAVQATSLLAKFEGSWPNDL